MKRTSVIVMSAAAAALLAAGAFYAGREIAHEPRAVPAASNAASSPQGERKVLYWQDPMVPTARFDKPGKSPFMDMPLVPVYADESNDSGVKVSAAVQQNLGIRTAMVKKASIANAFDAVGTVQFDDRLNVAVQSRVAGYIEHLAVRATMEPVRRGQPLATLYAPDWLAPLAELSALKRSGASPELLAAARDRGRALSIPQELVRQAEAGEPPNGRFTLVAPTAGVIAELGVREGAAVSPGTTLFRIAGLEKVWAVAEIPEAQAIRLARGQKVSAALQADPAQTFEGTLNEILPEVSANTRTLKARFEVNNAAGKLIPGMLLRVRVAAPATERLVLPAEAVIRTGTRAVAIVRKSAGSFEPREIKLGADLGDQLEVVDGLREGEEVVSSGQFLVDSEARLRSVLGAMTAASSAPASAASGAVSPAPATTYTAQGKVESVEADAITISHGPIAELKWPAMTMGFGKPDPKAFADVKPGDTVHFEFGPGGPMGYQLKSVHRMGAAK
jgi:membrane fusion protein, copper/silver efflux system